jgi:hypothetical protein
MPLSSATYHYDRYGAVINATNGIIINNQTISASYTIPVGSNAMSTGPVTAASGLQLLSQQAVDI